ncbi:M23 family metallopeptidase [Arenimonas aestuarii]
MRAGLEFLAGLLVGGLAVAWLVAEVPAESPQAVVVADAPAMPAATASSPAVLAPPRMPDVNEAGLQADFGDGIAAAAEVAADEAIASTPAPVAVADAAPAPAATALPTSLLPPLRIPVEGIAAKDLVDSFADARGQDRVHDALDIMAAEGTPVLAVADGPVVKLFDSVPGGITLYQFDQTGQVAFYYAHMQRYADGVQEGKALSQGDVLGYVGHTGNADPAAPHLHFAIFVLGPEKRWWQGEAINPYPLLAGPSRQASSLQR